MERSLKRGDHYKVQMPLRSEENMKRCSLKINQTQVPTPTRPTNYQYQDALGGFGGGGVCVCVSF